MLDSSIIKSIIKLAIFLIFSIYLGQALELLSQASNDLPDTLSIRLRDEGGQRGQRGQTVLISLLPEDPGHVLLTVGLLGDDDHRVSGGSRGSEGNIRVAR